MDSQFPVDVIFWADTTDISLWPKILFGGGRYKRVNPFDSSLPQPELYNTYTRMVIYAVLVIVTILLLMRKTEWALTVLALGVSALALLARFGRMIPGDTNGDGVVDERDSPRAEASDLELNPFSDYVNNPMPYTTPAAVLRKAQRPGDMFRLGGGQDCNNCLKGLYGSISEIDQGFFVTPVPDRTLTARPISFTEHSRPLITSEEDALGYRLARA